MEPRVTCYSSISSIRVSDLCVLVDTEIRAGLGTGNAVVIAACSVWVSGAALCCCYMLCPSPAHAWVLVSLCRRVVCRLLLKRLGSMLARRDDIKRGSRFKLVQPGA